MGKPLVLLVRDGWGRAPAGPGNAVTLARTPTMDRLLSTYPKCMLECSGEAVGVRKGAQGSSEVGHLNMGAGRIVEQEILRVDRLIASGQLAREPLLVKALGNCKQHNSSLHLMGLVQDQGVHATEEHLYALLRVAKDAGLTKVYVHFFADGRDTPPRSALIYLARLEEQFRQIGVGQVATVMGRYYGMDRGNNWDRTKRAYDAMVHGIGLRARSAEAAIQEAYARADAEIAKRGEAAKEEAGAACAANSEDKEAEPQEVLETDEFVQPTIIAGDDGQPLAQIRDNDSVIHFNYRQDRAIQMTRAFVEEDFKGFVRDPRPKICYVGLTRYYDEFENAIIPPMNMKNLLGEVLSRRGLWQLRISEYQKYRHVTSFFNGKRVKANPGEDRVQVASITIPEDQKPEMSAYEVTDLVLVAVSAGIAAVREKAKNTEGVTTAPAESPALPADRGKDTYDVIVLNYANCDMVGHTGSLEAAIKAVETVDTCVGRVVEAVLARDGTVLVTSDHGNAEQMIDPETGAPHTAHTTNDVDFVFVRSDVGGVRLRPLGILSDIAVTMLQLLNIPVPPEMTAKSLLE